MKTIAVLVVVYLLSASSIRADPTTDLANALAEATAAEAALNKANVDLAIALMAYANALAACPPNQTTITIAETSLSVATGLNQAAVVNYDIAQGNLVGAFIAYQEWLAKQCGC